METGEIHLDEDDPEAVEQMLLFLYTLSTENLDRAVEGTILQGVEMFKIADKYNVSEMKTWAQEKIESKIWQTECHRDLSDFSDLISELYQMNQSGSERLRAHAVAMAAFYGKKRIKREGFRKVIEEHPKFALEFAERLVEMVGEAKGATM